MTELFLKVLNMSIAASWLILAVVLLRLVLKKAPKWITCVFWALVAVRLVCPFSLESALSLVPSAETVPPEILTAVEPEIHTGIAALNSTVNPVITETFAPTTTLPTAQDPVAAVPESANPLQIITFVVSMIWLVGIAAMLVYALVSVWRVKRRVAASMPRGDGTWLCDEIGSPFILGIVKPRIYLPSNMDEAQLQHVIAHEQAHLARRDHWWKPLGYLLLAVYWFNPLCWVAYILLCRDIELACDEKVIKALGEEEKKPYSETLLACSMPRGMIAACPLAFGEVGVKARVKSVLHYKKPAFWVILAAVIACIAAAVCFLTNPKTELTDPFGTRYRVTELSFAAPMYSFVQTPENSPPYLLTTDGVLLEGEDGSLQTCGTAEEIELTKSNFDRYFYNNHDFWEGTSAAKLRRNNEAAWRVIVPGDENNVFYYFLQQKNGDCYLTYGYYDAEGETDYFSDDSLIRWVFKLEADGPVDFAAGMREFTEIGRSYVSYDCLYMSPLSSFYPIGGDSGWRYVLTEDAFLIMDRSGNAERIEPASWEWTPYAYSVAAQNLFESDRFDTDSKLRLIEPYTERYWLTLSNQYSLARMDDELWLVETRENDKVGRYLWSVYRLVDEESFGFAQWNHRPAFSSVSPYFEFVFEGLAVDSAVCTEGTVELAETGLRWSPYQTGWDGLKPAAETAKISFTSYSADGAPCYGSIYITGERDDGALNVFYTARVVGTGLVMRQREDYEGGVVALAENAPAAMPTPDPLEALRIEIDGRPITNAFAITVACDRGDLEDVANLGWYLPLAAYSEPGQEDSTEVVTVYAIAEYQAYTQENGVLTLRERVFSPVIMTEIVNWDKGHYQYGDFWSAADIRDASERVELVREKFSEAVPEAVLNSLLIGMEKPEPLATDCVSLYEISFAEPAYVGETGMYWLCTSQFQSASVPRLGGYFLGYFRDEELMYDWGDKTFTADGLGGEFRAVFNRYLESVSGQIENMIS